MLSKILLAIALVLLALKFGLRARLRELGRAIDRFVNVALVVIVVGYVLQVAWMLFAK
ncbi:MAG TPA: hypothetical protein VMS65_11560 [Polyangiaceae bacterium]|nr:hypothetical protein [Polyangiaceae bacterium]